MLPSLWVKKKAALGAENRYDGCSDSSNEREVPSHPTMPSMRQSATSHSKRYRRKFIENKKGKHHGASSKLALDCK